MPEARLAPTLAAMEVLGFSAAMLCITPRLQDHDDRVGLAIVDATKAATVSQRFEPLASASADASMIPMIPKALRQEHGRSFWCEFVHTEACARCPNGPARGGQGRTGQIPSRSRSSPTTARPQGGPARQ